jgi:hypothetical protein
MNYSVKNTEKHYPQANEWMWNYCFFLGKFTDSEGNHYDLGVYVDSDGPDSCRYVQAIVTDNEPGSYISGDMAPRVNEQYRTEYGQETYRRARILGIVPELAAI